MGQAGILPSMLLFTWKAELRGVEVGAGGIRSKEGNFERSTQQQQGGEGGGKAESTKSGE